MNLRLAAIVVGACCLAAPNDLPRRPAEKISDRLTPPPFSAISLDGYAGNRFRVNIARHLHSINPANLIEPFRRRPGKQAWIGEHAPLYVEAAILAWVITGDEALKSVADETVAQLLASQLPDGYLGTYSPDQRWQDWDVSTHRHVLRALLTYHRHTGHTQSLESARAIGDLLIRTFGETAGQRNLVQSDGYRGIPSSAVLEPMAMLFRQTGELKYLTFCRYILRSWETPPGPQIIATLLKTGSVQRIPSRRSAEILAVLNGLVELHRATGDSSLLKPVEAAWQDIVSNRLYPTGTTGWGRTFRDDGLLRADNRDNTNGPGDGATTIAWMDLNWNLLRLTGDARYADQLERTVYNALLGAQHPTDGRLNFVSPMAGRKRYGLVDQGLTGVNSSASHLQRGLALLPQLAWARRDGVITVNQYFSGKVQLPVTTGAKPQNVTLKIDTNFPAEGTVSINVIPSVPGKFALELRVPSWCGNYTASIAGQSYSGTPGEYLVIDRQWNDAARVEIQMDLSPRLISGAPSYPGHFALARGPQLLAVDETFPANQELWLTGLAQSSDVKLAAYTGKWPKDWNSPHAYSLEGYIGNESLPKKPTRLVFVPFAEVGQTGTEFRVWLPASP